ncbi:MAG: alkaline phosphatase family protein [Chthonomonadales bacterium]
MKRNVCVIGLDCADPHLVFDLFRPALPNLGRIMSAGWYGPLESTIPPITVPAWMCMMTGKDPGTLGIYGFRNRKDHSYEGLTFANSSMVREPAVWDLLAQAGKRAILLGVPLTYPPRPVNGLLVSGFLAPDTASNFTYPADLRTEILEVAPNYMLDVRNFRTEDKQWLLGQIYQMTEQRFRVARHLITTKPWDLFVMVEMGPDRIHHGFWRYFDRDHPLYEPGNPYESAIRDYYVELDRMVGEVLDLLPDDTLVLVVSDHGAKRMIGGICINEWLMQEGYLVLREQPKEPVKLTPQMVDWQRTKAWGDGGYYGRLFLNVEGREPAGTVRPQDYEPLRKELASRLEALPDEHGNPIGTRVFLPQEIYGACNNVPPDLIVYFGDLNWRSVGSVGRGTIWVHENDTGPDDANHGQYGICLMAGMDAVRSGRAGGIYREGMSIYDIAPTILNAFGITPPPGMGRSVLDLPDTPWTYTPEEEAEIARRLEDLGYL